MDLYNYFVRRMRLEMLYKAVVEPRKFLEEIYDRAFCFRVLV